MTGAICLSADVVAGSLSVDLTNNNCSVQYVMNNPLFIVSLPQVSSYATSSPGVWQLGFDLKMQSHRIVLTFDLLDGVGPNCNFDKLLQMSQLPYGNPITFLWGTRVYGVFIEQLVVGTQPGKLDYMPGCTMTLIPSTRK